MRNFITEHEKQNRISEIRIEEKQDLKTKNEYKLKFISIIISIIAIIIIMYDIYDCEENCKIETKDVIPIKGSKYDHKINPTSPVIHKVDGNFIEIEDEFYS